MSSNDQGATRRRRGSEQVTLKQVAQAAGVSAITASRALNTPERVNETTRARVLDAVETLGYVPNLVAGSLASARSRFIAVIVPSLANAVFIEVIRGLQETFEARGYQILLGNTDYDLDREYQLVRTFLGWSCSALVTAGLRHNQACHTLLANWDKPIVEVMELGEALDINVGLDHLDAGRCMARHLRSRHYQEIVYVGARMSQDYRAEMRYAGHREILAEDGLDAPLIELDQLGSLEAGATGLDNVLAAYPRAEAIHFANDDLAAGALLHARRRGLAVPGDIAIAGFNGLPLGQHITPRLTTIQSPRDAMGRLAAREVLRKLDGEPGALQQHDVGFSLLQGEST
ncbi:LacI family DNA-binding transcriptional regulator [Halomonas urumqiensis]|uniref:GntR family transcriptional regulator n=1 Tax=Halomonas urumqiensis TaxID=1684789 RepID=A0A2N7UQH9_9GAMM|nr:LacI family DNA-binding transcriptional regulator [Halomonas urumqiensis]PMR82693.1 GntR family transcriptional regulator [Halomonas urumqiensis]PTB01988.1 LacI family DNA-binding transcriptional regulator [Halomonas urumqiensis]GHE22102.1 LacI family transcriptional regulator [Halomonas urumqiensis]